MTDNEEIWMPVLDYENYEVSSIGRLRNKKSGRISFGTIESGYVRYKLTKNGKSRCFQAHILVARHFIPNPEKKPEVNHLGEKTDNRVCMLEWATRVENMQHAAKTKQYARREEIEMVCPKTGKVVKTYGTLTEAMRTHFKSDQYFYRCIKENIEHNGYLWRYANKREEAIIEDEIWVNLKDSIYDQVNIFPKYSVSNYGRVKGYFGRILTNNTCNAMHFIKLTNEIKTVCIKIHRLVIMAFNIPNPLNKKEVDHIDSNKTNNHLSNLRWATRLEQMNNENTIIKLSEECLKKRMTIIVTKDDQDKTYYGLTELSKEISVAAATINKYAKTGNEYKGYKFQIVR
jgi:hypothetical protein